jgi:hypothetical protein
MNKLLQHIMNAGDVDHKMLPGLQKMQKGGSGKILPNSPSDPRVFPKETLENRERVYRTVRPTDYTDVKNYARYITNIDRSDYDDERSEEAFKMYLGLEPKPQYFRPSKYKPTINATPNEYYYSADELLEQDIFNSFKDKVKPGQILPTDEWFVNSEFPGNPNAFWENGKQMVKFHPDDVDPVFGRPMVSRARALGQFVVSRGKDEQGEYLSYADQYDFPEMLQDKMQGKPYKIYGRIYYPKDKPKKMYGGDDNPFRVFAQEGVEYQGPSIVDYLATKGYSGKKAFRKELAEKYGVEDYNYSAAKNTELLNRLRENDDLLEQNYEQTQAAIPVERMMEMERQARSAREVAPAQAPPNPAPVYNYSPEFMNMRIPQTKINTSLQPKVVYDGKFSLTPRMVVQAPTPPKPTATQAVAPPVTAPRPQTVIPKFDPFAFLQSANQKPLGPVVNRPVTREAAPIQREQAPIPGISKPIGETFMFPNQYPYSFNKQKSNPVSSVVPANKPLVKTEKYTTESETKSETEELPWYEKAAGALKGFYDDFATSVNKSPLDFRGVNFGAGFSPEGVKEITKNTGKSFLSLFSEDLADKFQNKIDRQDAINNPKERKSSLDPSKIMFDPINVTGDTIPDAGGRRYHIPELMDLDYMRFGVRNRGDYKEIQTEGAPITTFEPFQSSKQYFAKSKDPANATYIGVAPDGKIKVGGKDQFLDQEYQITKTFGNKVVDFNRDDKGVIKKVASNPNASRETLSPSVKVMGDDGKIVDGKLSLLLPREGNQEESFDLVTGGRYIFQTPDGKTKLVSGSLKNIETAFYNMKKNNPYVNVITLDNGSYARGIRTFDQKLTKQDLKGYDNQNTGGGNIAYILPGVSTRYESKFSDFEKEAKARLQAKYPGKNVSVGYQDTGLYDKSGGRDIETQAAIQQKGNSQTPVSLHNFGAARDYILYVDGKPIDAGANKDLYADILWTSAAKTGLHHVGTKENNWDPAHIGLAKEGQKTAFDELYSKYPDIFANPNFVKSLNFVNKNKSNPQYQEYYELLNNIQPFTGQPRTTEAMRTTAARKQEGGPILDPRGQWAYPGKVTRIPSDNITMQGVPYPVFGVGSNGQKQMMYPEQEYNFGGASYVDEYPMMKNGGGLLSRTVSCSNCGWSWKAAEGGIDPLTCHKCGGTVKMKNGGQHGGLDRWFAEKWVDVKTGKDCGRQEGEKRAGYPACRPSKRVNSQTPKTSSEMSSAEKAKFKSSKTSSQRIDYNHKRNK